MQIKRKLQNSRLDHLIPEDLQVVMPVLDVCKHCVYNDSECHQFLTEAVT